MCVYAHVCESTFVCDMCVPVWVCIPIDVQRPKRTLYILSFHFLTYPIDSDSFTKLDPGVSPVSVIQHPGVTGTYTTMSCFDMVLAI